MNDRPLALLLTPVLPLPSGSGRALRAWDWLCELALAHQVHVLLVRDDATPPELPADYPAAAVWPLTTRPSSRPRRALGQLLPPLVSFSRRFALEWRHPTPETLPPALRACLAGTRVARLVVFRLYLDDIGRFLARQIAAARGDNADCTPELDLDDFESRTRLSVAAAHGRLGRYHLAAREALAALQYLLIERRLRGHGRYYLAAAPDIDHLPRHLRDRSQCRPNRLALPTRASARPSGEVRLLFVGTLGYAPNEDAIDELLRTLPQLPPGLPYRLTIVGRGASARLRARLRHPRIRLLDDVDDLAPCYAEADMVLVPLRAGGGTKLKSLEAFAYGRPLITTAHGVRGLGARDGEHVLLAQGPTAFAAAVRRLVDDPRFAQRLAEAGHRHFKEHFARP